MWILLGAVGLACLGVGAAVFGVRRAAAKRLQALHALGFRPAPPLAPDRLAAVRPLAVYGQANGDEAFELQQGPLRLSLLEQVDDGFESTTRRDCVLLEDASMTLPRLSLRPRFISGGALSTLEQRVSSQVAAAGGLTLLSCSGLHGLSERFWVMGHGEDDVQSAIDASAAESLAALPRRYSIELGGSAILVTVLSTDSAPAVEVLLRELVATCLTVHRAFLAPSATHRAEVPTLVRSRD